MSETPNYYGIIPANVRYDKDLRANAKLLYSELTCLATKEGYCYSSNNYFANLYDVDPSAVSKWIKQLSDKGYIRIEYIYEDNQCKERRIYINNNSTSIESDSIGIAKKSGGVLPPVQEGYCQKNKVNNTSNNNTSNINLYSPKSVELSKYLYAECQKANSRFFRTEKQLNQWANDIDKLNRIDNYTWNEIEIVLKWAKSDNFWCNNIQSGSKFREKFETLYPKAIKQNNYRQQQKTVQQVDLSNKIELSED